MIHYSVYKQSINIIGTCDFWHTNNIKYMNGTLKKMYSIIYVFHPYIFKKIITVVVDKCRQN